MRPYELAKRYAKAISELSLANQTQEKVFSDLRVLATIFGENESIVNFLTTPLIKSSEREAVLKTALTGQGVSQEAMNLVLLLAEKSRLILFPEIVKAFEAESDLVNNVCRGTVRSATVLDAKERQSIESKVEQVLNKKVIMSYKVDPAVIGGLVAQVGSYTFDDSISAHLKRMNEELNRRSV